MMQKMHKPLLLDEYIEGRIGPNPLNAYMKAFQRHIESMRTGASRWKCSYCGDEGKGISDVMSGRFKCFGCYMDEEYNRVSNDPDMIRKVRVWNLRAAREKKAIENEWKNDLICSPMRDEVPLMQHYLTEDEKEELAKKLMDTLDLPVNES